MLLLLTLMKYSNSYRFGCLTFPKADPFHHSWYQSLSQFQVPSLTVQLVLIIRAYMEIDSSQ